MYDMQTLDHILDLALSLHMKLTDEHDLSGASAVMTLVHQIENEIDNTDAGMCALANAMQKEEEVL